MLGSGDNMLMFGDYPYTPMPAMLKPYYLLCLSYYVEDLTVHLFSQPSFDYWEMTLHHIITLILVSTSYMNSLWSIGVFVLVQMDVEDIFIGLIRIFMDFTSTIPIVIVYLLIISSWIWLRFIAYFQISMKMVAFSGRLSIDNDVYFSQ
jgi:acyl-CoA-dependent ceramide synthase